MEQKKSKKSLIIGAGEIGRSLFNVLKDTYDIHLRDKEFQSCEDVKVIHICYPYSDKFEEYVKQNIKEYNPELVIIHSTVKPGTTKSLGKGVVYSPVNGKHPNLEESIRKFIKVVGGNDVFSTFEAVKYLNGAGIRTQVFSNSTTAEMAKILCTTRYGWMIVEMKEVARICDQLGLPFHEVYTEWNSIYNDGYDQMNCNLYHRPILFPEKGETGGHCVASNAVILHELGADFHAQVVLRGGQKLQQGENPLENRTWLYSHYWGQGKTTEEIGKEVGCTAENVCRVMKKLNIPRRDRTWTKEQLDKLKKLSEEFTFSEIAKEIGKSHDATRTKAIQLGIKSSYNPGEETKKEEVRKKISATLQGKTTDEWSGFSDSERKRIRKSEPYKLWRQEVFKKAGFKCEDCGKGGYLEAHHIKLFSEYPKGRLDINNGKALCKKCHRKIHFK